MLIAVSRQACSALSVPQPLHTHTHTRFIFLSKTHKCVSVINMSSMDELRCAESFAVDYCTSHWMHPKELVTHTCLSPSCSGETSSAFWFVLSQSHSRQVVLFSLFEWPLPFSLALSQHPSLFLSLYFYPFISLFFLSFHSHTAVPVFPLGETLTSFVRTITPLTLGIKT